MVMEHGAEQPYAPRTRRKLPEYDPDVIDAARDVMDAVRDVIPVACEALPSKMLLLWLRSIPCFNATAATREALMTKGRYDLKNPVANGEKNVVTTQSTEKLDEDIEAEDDRGNWSNQFDFFLSCLGFAVGLGNVWRFPYLCYKNGGGAFLIPYVVMLALAGLPLFFMELAIGQYSSLGPNLVYTEIAPIFQGPNPLALFANTLLALLLMHTSLGLGFGMLVITALVAIFSGYGYAINVTFPESFTNHRRESLHTRVKTHTSCGAPESQRAELAESYKSHKAHVGERDDCRMQNMTFWNKTCVRAGDFCNSMENFTDYSSTHCLNLTAQGIVNETDIYAKIEQVADRVSSSEDYYRNYVLEISSGIDDLGPVSWKLALCLLGAWIIVCACLIKGVKSSGKVVYFTALFPYVVLIILLIRGVTLPGALEGIEFYIIPKWHKLLDAQVWGDAAVQIFYSLGPAWGGLITLSSYNRFKNNCYRDAVIIATANCATSVFAGFVIFSILGFMAHTQEVPVDAVVKSSQALAFVAYPEALAQLPVSPVWSVLFFVMLITLGLDSQFTMVETITTALFDQFPNLRSRKPYIVVGSCFGGFILGLSLCTKGGVYMFNLMDWYAGAWSLLLIGVVECVVISWVYGYDRFADNIAEMIGSRPNKYWQSVWKYITPIVMIAILFFNWYKYQPASYGPYVYPMWAQAVGWLMAFSSVIMIPIFAVYQIVKAKKNGVVSIFGARDLVFPFIVQQNDPPPDLRLKAFGETTMILDAVTKPEPLHRAAIATLLKPTENWGPAHEREKKLKMSAKQAKQAEQNGVNEVNEKSEKLNGAYLNESFVPPPDYASTMQ
ncbi:Sodium- and chloride-dependent glycine transporter 2 [Nymphon striatum]|nr:Sodium- and chloride-dependent glycine transporter 2 [Nymphon striatum]